MGTGGGNISKYAQTKVLGTAVEGGDVRGTEHERGAEYRTACEEVMHPRSPWKSGHNLTGIGDAIAFGKLRYLLRFADVFAVGVVEGHQRPDLNGFKSERMPRITAPRTMRPIGIPTQNSTSPNVIA